MAIAKRHLRWLINLWPPFLGAGIRVTRLQPDWKAIDVEMKLRFWNANYVGTHFGGSLYAMTDPFYMLMLIENLGSDYVVGQIRERPFPTTGKGQGVRCLSSVRSADRRTASGIENAREDRALFRCGRQG